MRQDMTSFKCCVARLWIKT